jgi:polyisoprenoid-binding protein YceI
MSPLWQLVLPHAIGHTQRMTIYRHLLRRCGAYAIGLLAIAPLGAQAAATLYRYDTVHSQILFSIDHDGYSRPFGRLHIAHGWLSFDPDNWPASSTELDIDLASIDMGDADWNAALRKSAFFDTDKARYAHFVSTSVERKDDQHGLLHGQLTMRGVTQPVTLGFTWNRTAKTIYGLHTIAGFSATASLQRNDFGMTSFPNAIGQSVNIWLELEAIKDDQAKQPAASASSGQP